MKSTFNNTYCVGYLCSDKKCVLCGLPNLLLPPAQVRNDKQVAVLLKSADSKGKLFSAYRPNTGQSTRTEKLSTVLEKYVKEGDLEEAEKWWNAQYQASSTICNHAFW